MILQYLYSCVCFYVIYINVALILRPLYSYITGPAEGDIHGP